MLTQASDYKYQPTGNYDVTRTPVYASPSLALDRPLYYSDMLYLSEALACVSEVQSANSASANLIASSDDLPLSIMPLLGAIKSKYTDGIDNFSIRAWLNPSAVFSSYTTPNGQGLFSSSSFKSDFSLPSLSPAEDFTPDDVGDPLSIGKYLRAWNAIAKMKRRFLSTSASQTRPDLLVGTSSRTIKYYNPQTGQTTTQTDNFQYITVSGSYGEIDQSSGRGKNWASGSSNFHVPQSTSFQSATINGVVMRAYGFTMDEHGNSTYTNNIFDYKSLTPQNGVYSVSVSSDDAQAWIQTLGIDTSAYQFSVTYGVEYLDVTFTFRHEI